MTTYETEEDVRRALGADAKGYLVKGALPEQIIETVRRVAGGEGLLSPKIASKLTESVSHPELSLRELHRRHFRNSYRRTEARPALTPSTRRKLGAKRSRSITIKLLWLVL